MIFLMVFLIQNTRNGDAKAMHLKLDELIRSNSDARDSLIDLEDFTDEEIKEVQQAFQQLRLGEGSSVKKFITMLQEKLAKEQQER